MTEKLFLVQEKYLTFHKRQRTKRNLDQ